VCATIRAENANCIPAHPLQPRPPAEFSALSDFTDWVSHSHYGIRGKLLEYGSQSVTISKVRETNLQEVNPGCPAMNAFTAQNDRKITPPLGQQADKAIVLVIDDDPDLVAGLAKVLTAAGYVAQCCHDAHGAIESVRRAAPDLIISDINLGGESGLQLCERLKREEGLGDVPLMFLSGAQMPDIIRRSHEVGAIYYLRKPFDHHVLLELIDKALWMPHLVTSHVGV
jgi:CheY-like chemotaxis protein